MPRSKDVVVEIVGVEGQSSVNNEIGAEEECDVQKWG